MNERDAKRKKKLARRAARSRGKEEVVSYQVRPKPAQYWIEEFPQLPEERRCLLGLFCRGRTCAQLAEDIAIDRIHPGMGMMRGVALTKESVLEGIYACINAGFLTLVPIDPTGSAPVSKMCLAVMTVPEHAASLVDEDDLEVLTKHELVPVRLTDPGAICPACGRWFFIEADCPCKVT